MPASSRRFHSILFERPGDAARADQSREPAFFCDLNLDQVLAGMTAGRGEYRLEPFFYASLHDAEAVRYRQEIARDLEQRPVLAVVQAFAGRLRQMRAQLAQASKLHNRYQRQRWFLNAVDVYHRAVTALAQDLSGLAVSSRGLRAFRDYLAGYTVSDDFTGLVSGTQALCQGFGEITYAVHIKGSRVRVGRYGGEPSYSAEVSKTFAKFQQEEAKDYRVTFRDRPDMNHVEAQILGLVARLYPGIFGRLDDYCNRNQGYLDATVAAFDRQVQFYAAYLELIEPLRQAGLPFCYPEVLDSSREESVRDSFDLALARKLVPRVPVVGNGYSLRGPERILVVTGPNQGGKTTFARMFGQLHHLASLGLPVPGRAARLALPDQIFAHFEREEDIATRRGKLAGELARIQHILGRATGDSVVIMNESFTSATLSDALFLGTEIMRRIISSGLLCVYVTFVDELASLSEATVSMVAAIDPASPGRRTCQIVRRPADGLAYAAAVAAKYGLSYQRVKERVAS